mmetsp:Transcript_27236/g.87310  ORF Transcript_27236/g.87310 Transcript_27236/m.87310 type:complete len:207 (+) Transcript_27236:66-686(+)
MATVPAATAASIMQFLNEDDVVTALACARYYECDWATHATVTALDMTGFTVLAENDAGRKKQLKLRYQEELKEVKDIKPALLAMRAKCSWVRWPRGMMPVVILNLMCLAAAVALYPIERNLHHIEFIRNFAFWLCGSQYGVRVVCMVGIAAHAMESFLTYRMASTIGLRSKGWWALLALLLGFPALKEVEVLHTAVIKARKAKKVE